MGTPKYSDGFKLFHKGDRDGRLGKSEPPISVSTGMMGRNTPKIAAEASTGKGANETPTEVYDVSCGRNMGWPTWGDPQGDGIPIVLRERESRLHREVGEGDQAVRTNGMEHGEMAAMTCQRTTVRRTHGNV